MILFYCQHLLGVGHLTRSLAICRALAERFDVTLIQGGPDIQRTLTHPRFRPVALTPLLMREETNELYDPAGRRSPDEIFAERKTQLDALLARERAEALIVELFPFGRKKFAGEILHLLATARARHPGCRLICSLRDLLVEKHDGAERDRRIARIVREQFDHVAVHSDPAVIRLEETFSQTDAIADRIRYTGFVTEPAAPGGTGTPPDRQPVVLVSFGGGVVGADLAHAVLSVAPTFPRLKFRFLLGPYSPPEVRAAVERAAQDSAGQVSAAGFIDDFEAALAGCRLSISLAGYNTVMNLLRTRTPGLVYPHGANREQGWRAEKLARLGLLRVLTRADLPPAALRQAIEQALESVPAEVPLRLDGAAATRDLIAELIAS